MGCGEASAGRAAAAGGAGPRCSMSLSIGGGAGAGAGGDRGFSYGKEGGGRCPNPSDALSMPQLICVVLRGLWVAE